jgi:hypothetical protein
VPLASQVLATLAILCRFVKIYFLIVAAAGVAVSVPVGFEQQLSRFLSSEKLERLVATDGKVSVPC